MEARAAVQDIVKYIKDYTDENWEDFVGDKDVNKTYQVDVSEAFVNRAIQHAYSLSSSSSYPKYYLALQGYDPTLVEIIEILTDSGVVGGLTDRSERGQLQWLIDNGGIFGALKKIVNSKNLPNMYLADLFLFFDHSVMKVLCAGFHSRSWKISAGIEVSNGLCQPYLVVKSYGDYSWSPIKTHIITLTRSPVRLSKMLTALGYSEEAVTSTSKEYPSKGKTYELFFTDYYIPECYRNLASAQKLTSCMSHSSCSYYLDDDEHPTMAYEHSDCLLLLIKEVGSSKEFPYVARSIGSKKDFGYVRKYGLEHSCFTDFNLEEVDLEDHSLSYHPSGYAFLMPYLDSSADRVNECNQRLTISGDGEYYGNIDNGLGVRDREDCDGCGESVDSEDIYYHDWSEQSLCGYCYETANERQREAEEEEGC